MKRVYSPPVGRVSHPMEASSPRIRSIFQSGHTYLMLSQDNFLRQPGNVLKKR